MAASGKNPLDPGYELRPWEVTCIPEIEYDVGGKLKALFNEFIQYNNIGDKAWIVPIKEIINYLDGKRYWFIQYHLMDNHVAELIAELIVSLLTQDPHSSVENLEDPIKYFIIDWTTKYKKSVLADIELAKLSGNYPISRVLIYNRDQRHLFGGSLPKDVDTPCVVIGVFKRGNIEYSKPIWAGTYVEYLKYGDQIRRCNGHNILP